MKQSISRFILIVNLQTLVVSGLAVAATWVCIRFNYKADFPLTLIAISIVFPIVFSIGGAYNRREAALKEYAAIKGYLRSIYFVARDWMDQPQPESIHKMTSIIQDFFNNFRMLFTQPIDDMVPNEEKVYDSLSDLSIYINHDLRGSGLSAGECSRTNQYLQKMIISFESIKHIYQYRTPKTLRLFSSVFIKLLPILYGPYFAFIADKMSWGLEYVIPVLFTTILVSLDNIQVHLENPFDQIGEDDIKFNVEKFMERLEHRSDDDN